MIHRVTTSCTTSDNECQRVVKRVTTSATNDNEGIFWTSLFFFREGSTNRHPKENILNLEEDLEENPLNEVHI